MSARTPVKTLQQVHANIHPDTTVEEILALLDQLDANLKAENLDLNLRAFWESFIANPENPVIKLNQDKVHAVFQKEIQGKLIFNLDIFTQFLNIFRILILKKYDQAAKADMHQRHLLRVALNQAVLSSCTLNLDRLARFENRGFVQNHLPLFFIEATYGMRDLSLFSQFAHPESFSSEYKRGTILFRHFLRTITWNLSVQARLLQTHMSNFEYFLSRDFISHLAAIAWQLINFAYQNSSPELQSPELTVTLWNDFFQHCTRTQDLYHLLGQAIHPKLGRWSEALAAHLEEVSHKKSKQHYQQECLSTPVKSVETLQAILCAHPETQTFFITQAKSLAWDLHFIAKHPLSKVSMQSFEAYLSTALAQTYFLNLAKECSQLIKELDPESLVQALTERPHLCLIAIAGGVGVQALDQFLSSAQQQERDQAQAKEKRAQARERALRDQARRRGEFCTATATMNLNDDPIAETALEP